MPIGTNIFRAARVLGGGVIGGAAGGLASNSNTGTGQATDALQGALIGAGAGFMTTRWAWGLGKGITKAALSTGASGGFGLAKGSIGAGRWALRNPMTAVWTGAAGLGLYGLSRSGPQNANRSPAEMAQMSEMMGTPSTGFAPGEGSTRAAFEQSTEGLVQGLHHGRHRG